MSIISTVPMLTCSDMMDLASSWEGSLGVGEGMGVLIITPGRGPLLLDIPTQILLGFLHEGGVETVLVREAGQVHRDAREDALTADVDGVRFKVSDLDLKRRWDAAHEITHLRKILLELNITDR